MADLLPKAETESWCCYRKRILTSFLEAGNEARRTDEGKWGFNRRVKAWASTQSNANYNSRRRNTNESLSSYRRRIEEDFYDNEILRDYRQRVLRKEGKVELNRRIRAWAEGKPYVAPALSSTKTSIFPGGDLQEPSTITIIGYVVPETEDGTTNVAFLEHPLFHTTRVIMHMRHVPTDEYNGLHVSSLFNGDGCTGCATHGTLPLTIKGRVFELLTSVYRMDILNSRNSIMPRSWFLTADEISLMEANGPTIKCLAVERNAQMHAVLLYMNDSRKVSIQEALERIPLRHAVLSSCLATTWFRQDGLFRLMHTGRCHLQ